MNILENKRVLGLSALFTLAFGGVMYYGYSRSQDFNAAKSELSELSLKMEDFEAAKLAPTVANVKTLTAAVKQVEEIDAALQKQFKEYENKCIGDGKQITSVDFKDRVVNAINEVHSKAGQKGCHLAAPAEKIGMREFQSETRSERVVYMDFFLSAVKRVVDTVIDSGAVSLEKVYCEALPEDKVNPPKGKTQPRYFPLSFQVAFTAKRSQTTEVGDPATYGALTKIINSLSSDKDFFLTITGVSIASEANLKEIDAYQDTTATPNEGQNIGEEAAAAKPASTVIASCKTGAPDETVRVHLNLQVLFFTGKTK